MAQHVRFATLDSNRVSQIPTGADPLSDDIDIDA
jgi:hypothetical protein